MTPRLLILACCFVASTAYLNHAMEPERVPLRKPFSSMTMPVRDWVGGPQVKLTDEISTLLGVDDYVNRVYHRSPREFVSLYIGYYDSQRDGDTIHSPMNCLPGAGWQPTSTSYVTVTVPRRDTPITVKRVIIEKGLDRQVVLYWYQSHGRVVANEYSSKVLMVYDAVRLHRSDAALVRVVTPLGSRDDSEQQGDARTVDFVQGLFEQIDDYLPA